MLSARNVLVMAANLVVRLRAFWNHHALILSLVESVVVAIIVKPNAPLVKPNAPLVDPSAPHVGLSLSSPAVQPVFTP